MPRSSGTYTLPAGNPVISDTLIDPAWANTTLSDIGNELTNSLPRDGTAAPTANMTWGNFRLGTLGDPINTQDAVNVRTMQNSGSPITLSAVAGTGTTYTATAPYGFAALAAGQMFAFIPHVTNTGAATLNINGLGAVAVVRRDGGALSANQLINAPNTPYTIIYDGGAFRVMNGPATALFAASAAAFASANLPHGVAPTSPNNGDFWITTTSPFIRINGATRTFATLEANQTFTSSNVMGGPSVSTPLTLFRDLNAGDSTNSVQLQLGNGAGSQGSLYFSYTNADVSAAPKAQIAFSPRNNAGSGLNPLIASLTFTKVVATDFAKAELFTDSGAAGLTITPAGRGIFGLAGTADNGEQLQVGGTIHAAGPIKGPIGTPNAPAFTFMADQNTGMYNVAADELGFATLGNLQVGIKSNGRLYGTELHNNSPVTGTTEQYIASGTYTPTVSAGLNTSARTPSVCQWMRVGNVVTVSGMVTVTITANSATTSIAVTLPIASAITSSNEASGTCYFSPNGAVAGFAGAAALAGTVVSLGGGISGATSAGATQFLYFNFTYVIT